MEQDVGLFHDRSVNGAWDISEENVVVDVRDRSERDRV